MVSTFGTTEVGIRLSLLALLLATQAVPAPVSAAQPLGRDSDALPYQYIYLADFSRLRHLAEKGDTAALFQLGLLHYDPPDGSGIAQSYRRAFVLFFEASLRGHTTAQHNVGAMYWNGDYVAQNVAEGYAWFQLAALAGDPAGSRKLKQHAADLTTEQHNWVKKRLPELQAMLEKAKSRRAYEPADYGIR